MIHWVASRYLPVEGFRTSCQNLGNFSRPHFVVIPKGNLRASSVGSVYSRLLPGGGKKDPPARAGGSTREEPERASAGRDGSLIKGGAT